MNRIRCTWTTTCSSASTTRTDRRCIRSAALIFEVEVLDAQRQPVPIQEEWTFSEEPALTPAQEMLLEAIAFIALRYCRYHRGSQEITVDVASGALAEDLLLPGD